MRKSYLIYFLLLLSSFIEINAQVSDTIIQIEQSLKQSKEFVRNNMDSAVYYSEKALSLSKDLGNDTLLGKSLLQKSNVFIMNGSFAQADSILQLNLDKELPLHILGRTWHNLATILYYQQDFQNGLNRYQKAAEILEKAGEKRMLADTYANMGSLNAVLKNYENTRVYLEKALQLSEKEDGLRLKIVFNLATFYYDQKEFDKFIAKVFETERLAKEQNAKNVLAAIYTNLITYYTDVEQDHERALEYGEKSILLKKELNRLQSLSISYNNMGYSHLKEKEYQNAIKYFDSAEVGTKTIALPVLYNNMKDAYVGLKNHKRALHYADLKDKLKDSISEGAQKEKVAELVAKFESKKKQQQIDILDAKNELQAFTIRQQKYWFAALFIFGLLVIGLGYFGFRNFRTKQLLDKVLLRQKLLKTQLNPHFLFNALQSVQNFIHQNDKEKSSSYLTSYSKLIRLVLENADEDLISVSDDKLAIASYLNLQQLAHNSSFEYSVEIDEAVDDDFDRLPPLISQPFVENAVLHGIKDRSDGFIDVRYYKEGATLCVSIEDNGKGFVEKEKDEKRLHKSMSMRIIKAQFETLKKASNNFEGDIVIDDTSSGTKVVLRFLHKSNI